MIISLTSLNSFCKGYFTNYVCIYGWVGGQQNAISTTVKVQTRVRTGSKNVNFICESSLSGLKS